MKCGIFNKEEFNQNQMSKTQSSNGQLQNNESPTRRFNQKHIFEKQEPKCKNCKMVNR